MNPEPETCCSELDAFHDGVLDAASAERFQLHLESCPACQAGLEELRQLDCDIARAWEFVEAPVRSALVDPALRDSMNHTRVAGRPARLRRATRAWSVVLPLAAVLLIALAIGLRLNSGGGSNPGREPAQPGTMADNDRVPEPVDPGPPGGLPVAGTRLPGRPPRPIEYHGSKPFFASVSFPDEVLAYPVDSTPAYTVYAVVPQPVEKDSPLRSN